MNNGGLIRTFLAAQDEYLALSYKMLALWKVVEEHFEVRYLLKVDDDNYVRLDRLAIALGQWADLGAGGCKYI